MASVIRKTCTMGIFLFLIVMISSCSSSLPQREQNSVIDINDVLHRLPAQDTISRHLYTSEILRQAPASFHQILQLLDSEDSGQRTQAEYAVSLLSDYFGKYFEDKMLPEYIDLIQNTIELSGDIDTRNFLIEQIALCGTDASVDFLREYLDNEQLSNAALRAMVQINAQKTAKILNQNLNDVPVQFQVAFIKTLGELKYQQAAESILPFTDSENHELRQIARFSLANMGYLLAESMFHHQIQSNDLEERKNGLNNYILWMQNINDRNKKSTGIKEVIENKDSRFETQHRLTMLHDCIRIGCNNLYDYLALLLNEDNPKLKRESLRLTHSVKDGEMTSWLIARAEKTDNREAIVQILGDRGDSAALPFLYSIGDDTTSSMQKSTFRAIRRLNGTEWLVQNLHSCNNMTTGSILENELIHIDRGELVSDIGSLDTNSLTISARIVILNVIAQRNLTALISHVRGSLSDEHIEIRMAAINAAMIMEDLASLEDLINNLYVISDENELEISIKCISRLLPLSPDKDNYLSSLDDERLESTPELQTAYYSILKSVGGKRAFELLQSKITGNDNEAALEVLYDWPDGYALETLMNLASHSENIRVKVKATRASLRILRENEFLPNIRLTHYQKLMSVTTRPEEKQMILGEVMQIQTPESMDFVIARINDPDLREPAITALIQLIGDDEAKSVTKKMLLFSFPEDSLESLFSEKADPDLNIPPEGFVALFNGKNLAGWKGLVADPVQRRNMSEPELDSLQILANDEMRSHWYVENGILRFDGRGKNLCTIKDYRNFELLIDWKIEKNGDSGIYLRGTPQVQIKDQYLPQGGSGGLYNNILAENKPLEIADREPGEWNRFRIIMVKNKVTVYLNRRLVVDNIRMENYWERDRDAYETGPIELQAHNSPLYFRNIFIKEIPDAEIPEGKLFNGRDLSGWEIINSEGNPWHVSDSVLFTDGSSGGWLSTERQYDDFELTLEFKVSSGGNSGIFIRSPREGDPAYTGIEIQILDDNAEKYANLKPWQYAGSLYGIVPATKNIFTKSNQWQKMKIICDGPEILVSLNNTPVVETNLVDHMWQEDTHPGLKRRRGYIGLQSHGSQVEFRNINIEVLQ